MYIRIFETCSNHAVMFLVLQISNYVVLIWLYSVYGSKTWYAVFSNVQIVLCLMINDLACIAGKRAHYASDDGAYEHVLPRYIVENR